MSKQYEVHEIRISKDTKEGLVSGAVAVTVFVLISIVLLAIPATRTYGAIAMSILFIVGRFVFAAIICGIVAVAVVFVYRYVFLRKAYPSFRLKEREEPENDEKELFYEV